MTPTRTRRELCLLADELERAPEGEHAELAFEQLCHWVLRHAADVVTALGFSSDYVGILINAFASGDRKTLPDRVRRACAQQAKNEKAERAKTRRSDASHEAMLLATSARYSMANGFFLDVDRLLACAAKAEIIAFRFGPLDHRVETRALRKLKALRRTDLSAHVSRGALEIRWNGGRGGMNLRWLPGCTAQDGEALVRIGPADLRKADPRLDAVGVAS